MRSIQLLCICAAAATAAMAKSIVAPTLSERLLRTQDFLDFGASPICLNQGSTSRLEREALLDREHELASSRWPIATPCTRYRGEELCVFSHPDFADGRGISFITTPRRAIKILDSPAFRDPPSVLTTKNLNAAESPRWNIEKVPGKGMGLVAARRFEVGEQIMSSTVSMMIDRGAYRIVSDAQLKYLQAKGVDSLPARHKGIVRNLTTHDDAFSDDLSRIEKIIIVNTFNSNLNGLLGEGSSDEDFADGSAVLSDGLCPRLDNETAPTRTTTLDDENDNDSPVLNIHHEDEGGDEDEDEYGEFDFLALFPEISRMNHDCRPNANYWFDSTTFTKHVHAIRPIAAGEEISITYVEPTLPREARLERLNWTWGFPCSCSACTQSRHQVAASDERGVKIAGLLDVLADWDPDSAASPEVAELLISLLKMERMEYRISEAYAHAAIEYNGVGNDMMAMKYAYLSIQYGSVSEGSDCQSMESMKELVRNPREHFTWMLRSQVRAQGATRTQ